MKELLQQCAAYNTWADRLLTERILQLPEEQQVQVIPNSFPSLHLTLLHMWDAGSVWWQRIKLQETVTWPSGQFKGNTRDAAANLCQQDKLWEDWVNNASPALIAHVFAYQNSRKEHFKQPVYQVLQQVFNHNTYHRGQIVAMLRQLGADNIPGTDFIAWSRSNVKNVRM